MIIKKDCKNRISFILYVLYINWTNSFSFAALMTIAEERVLVGLEFTTPELGHRSASIVIEYGIRGRIEVTLNSGDHTHHIELEGTSDGKVMRRGRAAIYSPTIGDYEFELDKGSSSGIVVLTTQRGLHKVSFTLSIKK